MYQLDATSVIYYLIYICMFRACICSFLRGTGYMLLHTEFSSRCCGCGPKEPLYLFTVRLTFLAHSVRVRPNFQGLPWFKCYGVVEVELLIRFLLN